MKQKLLYIILLIILALAWSTGAWGEVWSQNYTYAPSEGDFNHIENHSVSLTDNNSGVVFTIYGNDLSTYSTVLSGLQIETSVNSLKWNVPDGYLITVTSVKARAGSDRSSKLKLGNQTSGSLFWSTKEVTCSGLSLGNKDIFSPIQAQSNRCFLYTLTITYSLTLDVSPITNAINSANNVYNTFDSNLSYAKILKTAITTAENSKDKSITTTPTQVQAVVAKLNAITNYVQKVKTAWSYNKNNIPDAVYNQLHQYDEYNPNNDETSAINNAITNLDNAISAANATTSAYQAAISSLNTFENEYSNKTTDTTTPVTDLANARKTLEKATTTADIDAALSNNIKQFDTITFNNISQIRVNNSVTNVASAHNSVSYYSSKSNIISVVGSTLTGETLGSAEITAYTSTGDEYYAVSATKPFTVIRNENTLTVLGNQELKVEGTKSGVYSKKNSDAEVKYSITDVVYTEESQNNGTGVISYNDSTNTITALNAGSATLTIYQEANAVHEAVQKSLTVTVTKYDQTLSWNTLDFTILANEMREADVAVSNRGLAVTYSSSAPSVIKVDTETGRLVGVTDGTATITASQVGNYKYSAAQSISHTFTVSKKQPIYTPAWGTSTSVNLMVGDDTSIELFNMDYSKFTVSALPTGVVTWSRDGNTLNIHAATAGTTKLTLDQQSTDILSANKTEYTVKVSKYSNPFAIASENDQEMKAGEDWTDVVTDWGLGQENTQIESSNSDVAYYDATDNKIKAVGYGTATITFTQTGTTTHEGASKSVKINVARIINTLSVTLPSFATEVGESISVSITGQNNSDAIVATITTDSISPIKDNKYDVITYANGVISARNAGRAKIKFTQAQTPQYTGYESEEYMVTVSKIRNSITITKLGEGTATNIRMKYNTTASLTYTSTNTDTSPVVSRASGSYTTYSNGTITAGGAAGTDVYEITQAETYKYEAGYASFTIRVNNTDEAVGYVLYEEAEEKHTPISTDGTYFNEYTLTGPGEILSFKAHRSSFMGIPGVTKLEVQCYVNGSWQTGDNAVKYIENLSTSYGSDITCEIPENTTKIRFFLRVGSTLEHCIKDIKVTRKTYVRATSNKTSMGTLYTDKNETATFTVNYSTTNGGNINVTSSNGNFSLSETETNVKTATLNVSDNSDGQKTFKVKYTPDPDNLGDETTTINISDEYNSATPIILTATSQKYSTSITRGSNTATETTVDNQITNAFAFTGTSAAKPTADSNDDFYYTISHTQTSGVNNGTGVISYDPATNTITGLNKGTARLTIYQKKTNLYHATSESFDFTVSKLANNVSIALSGTTMDVDGTVNVVLTNDVSKGAISTSFSGVTYTNESQNRDGGFVSYADSKITGVNAGTGTVKVTQAETYKYEDKSQEFTVTVNKLPQTLSWDDPYLVNTIQKDHTLSGNTATSNVGLTPVTYASDNIACITVDATTGELTAVAAGSNVTITASQAGNYKYQPATLTRQFSVFEKKVPVFTPDAHFVGNEGRVEITGSATITVTDVSDGNDFSITGYDNTIISVSRDGETITITGLTIGNTTLTLAQAGNDNFIAKSQTYEIEVYLPDDFLMLSSTTAPTHAAGNYKKIFFTRSLKKGYSTIALPFTTTVAALTGRAANADDWVAQLSAVTKSAADGYTLYFQKVEGGTITANLPYILHLGSAVENPTWTDMTDGITVVAATAGENTAQTGYSEYSDWVMKANYSPNCEMEGKYGVVNAAGTEGALKKGGAGSTLKAYTAYIIYNGAAPTQVKTAYLDEDEADAILELIRNQQEEMADQQIYDLQGRRLSRTQRGVNIIRQKDGTTKKVKY